MPNPNDPGAWVVDPFPADILVNEAVKPYNLHKFMMDEAAIMDELRRQKATASMNANRKILEQKNGRIAELSLTLEQYSGCLTQNDIMKIVNRVAELNGLPKFFPKGRQQHPLNKTLFVNELSNYLFAATSRPDVDTLAE